MRLLNMLVNAVHDRAGFEAVRAEWAGVARDEVRRRWD